MADFQGGVGASGGGGIGLEALVSGEFPGGAIDGVNATFTLANPHTPGTLQVFLNGQLLIDVDDYTIATSTTFTLVLVPQVLDRVVVGYVKL